MSEKNKLLVELISDPIRFSKQGKAYKLLEEYFKGLDLETLRPLLRSKDLYIQSAATFITSELGKKAASLLDDVVPLLSSDDRNIKFEAIETIMASSSENHQDYFTYVLEAMNDEDEAIRTLTMGLVANADVEQIMSAIRIYSKRNDIISKTKVLCLKFLLKGKENDPAEIDKMLISEDHLLRKYGVIIAKRIYAEYPNLINEAAKSNDSDVRVFAYDFLKSILPE